MDKMNDLPDSPELKTLYEDFEKASLAPLWTQLNDLMPEVPTPKAVAHVWRWKELLNIAERSGELVPVGRGGERRALGLRNPGLPGTAYASSTLWCAIQYLVRMRPLPNTATAKTPSASWLRALAFGPW
jgi:gentisate 1,2-dioxygenase